MYTVGRSLENRLKALLFHGNSPHPPKWLMYNVMPTKSHYRSHSLSLSLSLYLHFKGERIHRLSVYSYKITFDVWEHVYVDVRVCVCMHVQA